MLKDDLKRYAESLGFERLGVTSAQSLTRDEKFLESWLEAGRFGEMDYMNREPQKRAQPKAHLPSAQSVISMAMNYYTGEPKRDVGEGKVARYAWGKDYHKVIGKRLEAFVRYLESQSPESVHRTFLDTGPLLERAFAQQAGLGFIGKNTMLITKGLGSWVFLATIVTSAEIPIDGPDTRNCGTCRLCIDACPTEAITEAYSLDARRCLSYLTIEAEGPVAVELRGENEGWIFGCDICQEVCPHNTRTPLATVDAFQGGEKNILTLAEILSLSNNVDFKARFASSPVIRAGMEGLQGNACLAAVTLKRRDLLPQIDALRRSASSTLRDHAEWAYGQLAQVAQNDAV